MQANTASAIPNDKCIILRGNRTRKPKETRKTREKNSASLKLNKNSSQGDTAGTSIGIVTETLTGSGSGGQNKDDLRKIIENTIFLTNRVNITIVFTSPCPLLNKHNNDPSSPGNTQAKLVINTCQSEFNINHYPINSTSLTRLCLNVDAKWLLNKIPSAEELHLFTQLFSQKPQVLLFNCPSAIQQVAAQLHAAEQNAAHLNSIKPALTLSQQLLVEKLSFELINQCLPFLSAVAQGRKTTNSSQQQCSSNKLLTRFESLASTTNISLSDIATTLGISISKLQREVKSYFGQTAMKYIKQQRLEKAKRLLTQGELSIGEVAYLAGYRHSSNFITAFKLYYGLTPAQLTP